MMGTQMPYVGTGRSRQKGRTRDALVAATRELMSRSGDPTVEQAAAHAGISRTTAYRYFPRQRDLLAAAYPQIERESLLPDPAPADVHDRLDAVIMAFLEVTTGWEPQLRSALRLSLEPGADHPAGNLRRGRAIAWIEEALEPLERLRPELDRRRLAVAIRSATGIESFVWLTDVAGLSRHEASAAIRSTAHALLRDAVRGDQLQSSTETA